MSIIVVGAGIIGSALAYRLAQAGARVTVLDAGRERTPTTAASVSWINSHNKAPLAYHRLNVAGMGEHRALELELDSTPLWHHTGTVEWAVGTAERDALLEKVARLQGWGYPAELIDRDGVCAIDPALTPPEDATAFAFFGSESYVDAVPLAAALLDRARALRAEVRITTVTSLAELKGKAQYVVCAAGRWTGALLGTIGFELPMAPTRGCLAITSPANVRLRTMLYSSALTVRPDAENRLLLQNTSTDVAGDEPALTIPPERQEELLLARARRVVRGLETARLEQMLLGIRPIPGDGCPVVGPVPGNEWLYVVCSHSGVTLAPFYARAVTRELLGGSIEERLAPYRPQRFCAVTTSR